MDALAPSTSQILERLVAFDTTSRNSNLALMAFVREIFVTYGVRWHESRDPSGQKANMHGLIGPDTAGGLALSGHVDTVPVEGQAWTSDPFRLRAEGDRLYGRGTTDMKGFVAAMLAAVPDLVALPLARPIHLLITFDEETTMAGARRLIEQIDALGPPPALCVVGEPSLMRPILGHKGRLAARATVRGLAGHSADPSRGVNAIHAAAQAIGWIAEQAARAAREGPFAPEYQPPHTTSQVGTIDGGAALNIIADSCDFTVEWRPIPGDDARAALARLTEHVTRNILPGMQATHPQAVFGFEVTDWVPGMALPPEHELATAVRRAAGSNGSGYVGYATEGGLFQEAGIPTIVCGPGFIGQAHMADEWIDRRQLDAADRFIRLLAGQLVA